MTDYHVRTVWAHVGKYELPLDERAVVCDLAFQGIGEEIHAFEVELRALLVVARRPRGHHEPEEMLVGDDLPPELDELADHVVGADLRPAPFVPDPVRAARDLVEAGLLEVPELLEALAVGRLVLREVEPAEALVVVPVRLHHALRAPREVVGMVPAVVAPHPRTASAVLRALDRVEEVVPPHLARAHDEIVAVRGESSRLLVVAEVEEG